MPLPTNTTLSLLGYSRPGDPVQTKPKEAMLVRLSIETLNALSTNGPTPSLSVQLGDNPTLYVGDTVFPMNRLKETNTHEIFLRTSSASKKSAPLKLYANVVGKLTVERELGDEVRNKVRESTQDAAAQRNTRTTVFLDTPPDVPSTKKRKDPPSNMFHKSTRPSAPIKAAPVAASSSSSMSSSVNKPAASTSTPKSLSSPARLRIVQHLALYGEATESRLFQLLGESDRTSTPPRQLHDLLSQIAEPTANKTGNGAPRSYRLKPETWKEVRPYEWGIFSEQEQLKIARTARNVYRDLRISESDPVWQHVVYRHTAPTSSDASRVSSTSKPEDKKGQEPVKRGITSKAAKERATKPKADLKGDIIAKDESSSVPSRATQSAEKPIRRTAESPRPDPIVRTTQQKVEKPIRKPAESPRPEPSSRSVSQADKPLRRTAESPHPDGSSRSAQLPEKPARRMAESPRPDPPPRKGEVANPSKTIPRPSTSSQIDKERDRDPPRAAPPKVKPAAGPSRNMERVSSTTSSNNRVTPVPDTTNSASKSRKAYRDDDRTFSPEREKRPLQNERIKVNDARERERQRDRERDSESVRDESRSVKRKIAAKPDDDLYDPPQKRRKSERQPSPSVSLSREDRERDDRRRDDRIRDDRGRDDRGRDDRVREDRGRDVSSVKRSNAEPPPPERSIPRKPNTQSTSMKPPKRKNESPPPPPAKRQAASTMRERMPSESSVSSRTQTSHATERTSHANKAPKQRRPSPVYTSSEEEEEPSRSTTNNSKLSAASATALSHARGSNNASAGRPLPKDHASLRAQYDKCYIEYLGTYHRLAMFRGKINKLLSHEDLAASGFVTDSDGDDLEELSKLTREHGRLEGELKSIRAAFGQNMDGDLSPESLTP
ncbi:hypothetical protein JR316_0002254 [Psilocybe cubensis]|uniref:Uncharacterized protein n=2 Tax=Psilocybe cubensis TaxID=181762 RepID=A0ACB8HBN0_PSICU|nr:hypothetical protein JR316_0002254 [Psilocybe cubensis]KAH9485346.1 hypothetical protein JR316_0002254 [Psilocybe cubensis]